jgi:formylglycine-generating enzyme required for sulfatase activity
MAQQTNPAGPSSGKDKVMRGGGWRASAVNCRVSSRNYGNPGVKGNNGIGFRLAMSP